jgi:hypothetical protein
MGSRAPIGGRIAALAVVVAVTCPAADQARAQQSIAPRGNSGVQQYLEAVPTARGNTPGESSRPDPHAVAPAIRRHLEQHGEPGRKLVEVVSKTSPPRRPRLARPAPKPRLPVLAPPRLVSAGPGDTSVFLPLTLIGSTVVLVGLAVTQRRRRT